jgi:hypothetical protein
MSKRGVVVAFSIGMLVPLFWGFLGLLLFNVPEGPASRIFWTLVYLTCPSWALPGALLTAFVNGCLYVTLYVAFVGLSCLLRKTSKPIGSKNAN